MKINRHILKIIFVIVSVSIIGYFLKILTHGNEILEHNGEIITEFFTIFILFSIFAVTWSPYNKSRDNHALFIGVAFALVGFIDLFHTLSYHFMPDFITPNTVHKSAYFWTLGRILSAVFFLLSVYIYKNTLSVYINKRVLSVFGFVLLIAFSITGLYYHDYMPLEILGEVFTTFRIVYLLILAAVISYTIYLYTKRLAEHKNEVFLIYGFVLLYFSDLIYFSFEMSAHLLKAIGFYYVFVSMYKSSVQLPYERLTILEKKLRHSAESRYKSLFDNAGDAIVTMDAEKRIDSWNHGAELLFGWSVEEVIGKKIAPLLVPERMKEEPGKVIQKILDGEKVLGLETVGICKDGTEKDLALTVSAMRDINNKVIDFSVIIRDITEIKKYEASLQKSKEFMETVLDSMNDLISIIDVKNFKIIDVNKIFLDTYGLSRDEVVGKTCYGITHDRNSPCTPPDDLCPLMETLETGKHSVFEHVHYAKGEKHYVEVSTSPIFDEKGELIQVVHVSRDITERKLAEMALMESEEKFRSMAQTAIDAIIIADENGNIASWNKGAENLFDYTVDDLLGKSLTIIMPERYREAHRKGLKRILKGEKPKYVGQTIELYGLRKDGSEFPTEVSVANWKTENGVFFGGIIHDITERKHAEELRLENIRLTLADKTKSEFLSTMSHELRTPLNATIGFSELLKQGKAGKLNEKQEHFVDNILNGGKHLLELIANILDLTKMEAGKMELEIEKVSLPEIIHDTLSVINILAEKRNVVIKKEIDPQLDFIDGESQKIKQILLNVLNNAVKFSKSEGGTITVTTRKDGDMAKISVSDTGIGIKEEHLGRLFKDFEQLDAGITRKYEGTGLGLAISKKLVEMHSGTILVESEYGVGSTFTITLPIVALRNHHEHKR